MSRSIKNFIVYCLFLFLISGCGGHSNIPKNDVKTIEKQIDDVEDKYNDNIYKQDESEAIEENNTIINRVEYNPIDVVDGVLQNPSKKINIALIVPTTGKYASVGKMITESAMLTLNKSKFEQVGKINVYNITNLKKTNWKEDEEVKRLLNDNNDVIIGAGEKFEDTTKKILSVLPEDKLFIGFINDTELAKQYPNLVALGVDERYKIHSLFQYLKDYKRQFVSLILPATKKGYNTEKMFRKLAPYYEIFVVSSQFYQSKSKASILASVRGITKTFKATYIVDENGKFTTETYKQNKQKKLNQRQDLDNSMNIVKTQSVDVNAIYIDAEENDLITILNSLERFGVLNKNVQIFSSSIFDIEHSFATKLDNVLYVGYNYNVVDSFNKSFKTYFKHLPNYFAYITYDTLSMLFYVSSMWNMIPRQLYTDDGFRGILDEFRFTRDGNIERRMGIYRLNNQIMSRVFVPEDYISLDTIEQQKSIYFS